MPIANGPYVWYDGKVVRWEEATVHVAAHAMHYGSSVFEGIRAYETVNGTAIFRLQPHAQRLVNGCKIARLGLPYSAEEISQAVQDVVARNGQASCYIRPLAFRGVEALSVDGRRCPTQLVIFTMAWGRYLGPEAIEQGVDVGVSSWRRLAPATAASLAKIGGQYVNSQFASMEAHDNGFAEALVLDVQGHVSEGGGENLFMVMDGVLYTPPLVNSILGGITRDAVLTLARDLGYPVREQGISRDMLYMADELFFTGTAAEISPIRSIDRVPVGRGSRGPVTKVLQEQFFGIVSGNLPDKYGWLTPVKLMNPATGD